MSGPFPQKPARRYTNPRMGARAAMQEQERQEEEAHDEFAEFPLPWRSEKDRVLAADEWQVAICCGYSVAETIAKLANATASVPVSGSDSTVFPTEAQVQAVAGAMHAAVCEKAGLAFGLECRSWRNHMQQAQAACDVLAPLVNGIADQRDAAVAEAERAWTVAGGGRCEECGEVVTLNADGTLSEHMHESTFDTEPPLRCDGSGTRKHEAPNLSFRLEPEEARKRQTRLRELERALSASQGDLSRLTADLSAVRAELEAARAENVKLTSDRLHLYDDRNRWYNQAFAWHDELTAELASLREELAEAHRVLRDQGREIGCECFELGDGKYRPEECPIHGPFIDETRPPIKRAGSLPDNALDSVLRVVTDVVDLTDGQRLVLAMNLEPLLSPVVPAAAAKTCNEIVWPEGEDENGEPCIRDRGHGGVHQTEHYYYDAGQSAWLRMVVPVPVEQWVADDPEHRRAYQADDGSQVFEVGYRPVPVEPPAAYSSADMLRILPSHLREIAGDVTTHPEETRDALLHWADEIESWPAPAAPGVAPTAASASRKLKCSRCGYAPKQLDSCGGVPSHWLADGTTCVGSGRRPAPSEVQATPSLGEETGSARRIKELNERYHSLFEILNEQGLTDWIEDLDALGSLIPETGPVVGDDRYTIRNGWLCAIVNTCTCCGVNQYGHEAHEPGCGLENLITLDQLDELLAPAPPVVGEGAE